MNQELIVNGGEIIGLSSSADNIEYAIYEFDENMNSSGGQTHGSWFNLNNYIILNSKTRFIRITFKNGDGTTDFTDEQLTLLPFCLEFKSSMEGANHIPLTFYKQVSIDR